VKVLQNTTSGFPTLVLLNDDMNSVGAIAMSQDTKTRMTFEEYLSYDDGTDKHYEFVGGELIEMPPESPINSRIAIFLLLELGKVLSEDRLCHKDTEIAVSGTQVQTRLPDLMVLGEELAQRLDGVRRGTILLDMPPPELIIEVVSSGKTNEERDYRFKRSEYAARGVPEYWVIDPQESKITGFTLEAGFYEEAVYTGEMNIQSQFEVLRMTAEQVLKRKR
jgi:Uma2 family endonuclease